MQFYKTEPLSWQNFGLSFTIFIAIILISGIIIKIILANPLKNLSMSPLNQKISQIRISRSFRILMKGAGILLGLGLLGGLIAFYILQSWFSNLYIHLLILGTLVGILLFGMLCFKIKHTWAQSLEDPLAKKKEVPSRYHNPHRKQLNTSKKKNYGDFCISRFPLIKSKNPAIQDSFRNFCHFPSSDFNFGNCKFHCG